VDFEDLKKLDNKYVMQTYAKYPLALERGSGCRVWDSEGKEYLDMLAGIAVCVLGHSHPKLVKAMGDQAKKLIHVSNLFYIENQAKLGKLLNDLAPMKSKTFFCNSGAEANEAAIKFSRKFTGRREIIAMSNSFHGRTMGSLAITDKKKYQKPFEPLMPETKIVKYGDMGGLKKAVNDNTAAVFTELVQGEGGVKFPMGNFTDSVQYFKEMRELCDENGIVMVVDEVQTGSGRTGTYFASEKFGVVPDIITSAKGVAGGFPMGIVLAKDEIANSMAPGDHASTFGGSPLGCAASLATIEAILDDKLLENAENVGEYLVKRLSELDGKARGLGLMVGFETESEEKAKETMEKVRDRGVLVNVTGHNVIRMVPPLILAKKDVDFAVDNIEEAMK
jgi:predicted acetylornithine/succinylornithine family transaminase